MACLTAPPPGTYGVIIASLFLLQRSRTGPRRRGKKSLKQVEQEYLDDALAKFSGYIAIDELYDGPFCVLSIVDNRTFRRLAYRVLDHLPPAQRQTLQRITRGLPQLRVLREIMDQVYGLFDR